MLFQTHFQYRLLSRVWTCEYAKKCNQPLYTLTKCKNMHRYSTWSKHMINSSEQKMYFLKQYGNIVSYSSCSVNVLGKVTNSLGEPTEVLQYNFNGYQNDANKALNIKMESSRNSKLGKQFRNCKSVDQVLVLFSSTKEKLIVEDFVACLETLGHLYLKQLKMYSWAYYNNDKLLWIQSDINYEAKEMFASILCCPEFNELCRLLEDLIHTLSDSDLTSVTRSLFFLHPSHGNRTVMCLVNECLLRSSNFDLENLVRFAEIGTFLRRNGFPVYSKVCNRLTQILEETPISSINLEHLAIVVNSIGYFCSEKLLKCISGIVVTSALKSNSNLNPSTILLFLEVITRFVSVPDQNFLKVTCDILSDNSENLYTWQLGTVLRFLRVARFQDDNLLRVIRKTGLERLKQGLLRSSDLVSLLNLFDLCGWNEELRTEIEELLMLHVQDFDVILLKHCAQSQFMIHCENQQVLDKFSDRVLTKLPDLLNAISCLLNVLSFYSKARYQNPVFHSELSQFLLKQIQSNQITYQPSHLAVFFKYMLACLSQKRELPTVLMSAVSNMLSQFAFTDVISIARTLNLKTVVVPSNRYRQNLYIYKSLQQCVLQQLSEVPNINILCMLIKVLFVKSNFGYRFEYAEITRAFEGLISTVDDNSFNSVLLILTRLKLFIPDVLEHLAQFCLKNQSLEMISFMLQTCAFFNFNSEKSCLLAEECLKMLEISSTLNLVEVLGIVYSLAVLEIFPKEIIKKIFSMDFLRRLDNFCENHPRLKYRLHEQLEILNRIVALECPELDIPWFHEHFYQELSIIKGPKITTERRDNVLKVLPDVLGGQEFYRTNQTTPYFYDIDFECALTPSGQPVSFRDLTPHNNFLTSLKRVALVILEPHHYCANVNWKLGKTGVMLRHLEMLGYTVVELPYMELDSISQSHRDLLADYLKTKIFQSI